MKDVRRGKATPTDFSEAETSSSGFADETSSKATQTDTNPGSFLCLIEDGPDTRFSIYDTLGPIENHFRKTPGYRSLFREIFDVLKRAAQSKDDGERPPMLDDQKEPPKVPPVTPANENLPYDFEDLVSLQDSMAQSEVSSLTGLDPEEQPEKEETGTKDILEYVTATRQQKKKKRASRTPTPRRRDLDLSDYSESAESSPFASPMRTHRRRARKNDNSTASPGGTRYVTTLQRTKKSDGSQELSFMEFKSTAAQEVAKLKRLEKSYAEVLACSPMRPSHAHAQNSRKSHPPSYGKK